MDAAHERTAEPIGAAVERPPAHADLMLQDTGVVATAFKLLQDAGVVAAAFKLLQDTGVVAAAFKQFHAKPALRFYDSLLLELARQAGHLALGPCNRQPGKLAGVHRL